MGLIWCLLWHAGTFKQALQEVFPPLHVSGFVFKEKKATPWETWKEHRHGLVRALKKSKRWRKPQVQKKCTNAGQTGKHGCLLELALQVLFALVEENKNKF